MVQVVNATPHPSVVKEVICHNCGVTLSYVPADKIKKSISDYLGERDYYYVIECPACKHELKI